VITSIVSRLRRTAEGPARQNVFGSLLIQGSLRLSRFLVFVAAAALLTPSSFAAAVLALSLADLVRGGLQAFDVDAVRLLSRGDDAARVVHGSLDAKGLAGFVAILIVAATAALIYDSETAWLSFLSGVGALLASFASSFLVRRQAALALRSISLRITVVSLLGTVIAVVAAWLTHSALGVVVGVAIGDSLLLALLWENEGWHRPDWRAASAQTRLCRRLLVMQFAYIGQFRVGTIVLALAGSAVAVGEYSIASRITEGMIILAAALTSSSLPMIGAAHARNEQVGLASIFERCYGAGLRLTAPLIGALIIAAPLWIWLLFPRYPNVGPPSAVVGLAVILYFASSQTTALLNATHHDRAASWSAVAGLLASVIGVIVLRSDGAVGVAWARVAGEFVRLAIEALAAVRVLAIRPASLVRPWLALSPVFAGMTIAVVGNWQPVYVSVAVVAVIGGSGIPRLLGLRHSTARV